MTIASAGMSTRVWALAVDGASVRSAALWIRRTQPQAAASPSGPVRYTRAYPGMSVWYTASVGSGARPAPRMNGLARWTSSARWRATAERSGGPGMATRKLR